MLPFFSSDNSDDIDTKYPDHVEEQIKEFSDNYKKRIEKENNHAERIKNYAYLSAAYFTGKTLLTLSISPMIIAVSVVIIAMIPSVSDLDGFNANYNNGLELQNMQKPLSFIFKALGAGFLAYGVLANYYTLKSMTERTYEVIDSQIQQYEGNNQPTTIPGSVGVIASIALAIAAFYFVPKRPK
ncbi:hypothetical protein WA1_24030 [Scytonema hofmannii PCC 7110]|uniref:Uncharacterized protein n=2 Tax=Scytonema hofmannii TaxID=34078 RepID=A0A139X7V9_9CYAN|nr:hypothetical protein WA1_24030 [Scytonema hofmannii PCC 7110]